MQQLAREKMPARPGATLYNQKAGKVLIIVVNKAWVLRKSRRLAG
jgi:hypothetical protein